MKHLQRNETPQKKNLWLSVGLSVVLSASLVVSTFAPVGYAMANDADFSNNSVTTPVETPAAQAHDNDSFTTNKATDPNQLGPVGKPETRNDLPFRMARTQPRSGNSGAPAEFDVGQLAYKTIVIPGVKVSATVLKNTLDDNVTNDQKLTTSSAQESINNTNRYTDPLNIPQWNGADPKPSYDYVNGNYRNNNTNKLPERYRLDVEYGITSEIVSEIRGAVGITKPLNRSFSDLAVDIRLGGESKPFHRSRLYGGINIAEGFD